MSGFSVSEGDVLLARLVAAREQAGDEHGESFLARLVLLLAAETGDLEAVLRAIDAALDSGSSA